MHQLHFTLRDSIHDYYWNVYDRPEPNTLYFHMDFLQHKALPMGPDESAEMWYGNAQLGITILVILVWSATSAPTFHVYCSHCKNQDSHFAVACLLDPDSDMLYACAHTTGEIIVMGGLPSLLSSRLRHLDFY